MTRWIWTFLVAPILMAGLACSQNNPTRAVADKDAGHPDKPVLEAKERISFRGHAGAVAALVFLGKGQLLASASSDRSVRLWDLTDDKQHSTLNGHEHAVQALAATSDGRTLASADDRGVVKIWDVPTCKERGTLPLLKGEVNTLSFSPSGKILASGGGGFDKMADRAWSELKLWDWDQGKQITNLEGHPTRVTSVAFAPDGKTLASCSADGTALLWQTAPPHTKTVLGKNPKGATSVGFSPDGKTVACGSFTESTLVKFWDTASGKELPAIEDPLGACSLSLAYLPDGKTLVLGGLNRNTIQDPEYRGASLALWDPATHTERLVVKGHFRAILAVALNREGNLLAAGGLDGVVRVWDLAVANR